MALGCGGKGNPGAAPQEVHVARAIPFWLLPLAVLTLACLALSWFFARRHRRAVAGINPDKTPVSGTP